MIKHGGNRASSRSMGHRMQRRCQLVGLDFMTTTESTQSVACTYCGGMNQITASHQVFYRCDHCEYDVSPPEEHSMSKLVNEFELDGDSPLLSFMFNPHLDVGSPTHFPKIFDERSYMANFI